MRPEQAANVITHHDLPGPMQEPAAQLLTRYGEALTARGDEPDSVACHVEHLLLELAVYEPNPMPSLDAVLDGKWPWSTNRERRRALIDPEPNGYLRAWLLRRKRDALAADDEDGVVRVERALAEADEWWSRLRRDPNAPMPPIRRREQSGDEADRRGHQEDGPEESEQGMAPRPKTR